MKYLVAALILISTPAFAGWHKLLVVDPNGNQLIQEVGQGGSYNAGPTLWDESVDGPLPTDLVLDAMVVDTSGGVKSISVDESKRAAAMQKIADAEAAKKAVDDQAAIDKATFAALKAKIKAKTATAADVRDALKFILQKMGE